MKKGIVCALFTILIFITFGVRTQALKIDHVFTGYYFSANGKQEPWVDSQIKLHNGEVAYCISLYDDISWEDVYSRTPLEEWNALTEKQKETVTAIAAFGYGYQGRTDPVYYSAASDLIWHITDVPKLQEMKWVDSQFNRADAVIAAAKNEIMNDVNRYFQLPSFTAYDENNQEIGNNHAEGYVGKTIRFIDQTGVLENTAIVSSSFKEDEAVISGNTVTIQIRDNVEKSITFSTGIGIEAKDIPFLLTNDQYQNVIVRGRFEPSQISISVKGLGKNVTIEKKDDQGNDVIGAFLQLFDETDGHELIEEFTSDGNPKTIQGLNPAHTYCIHEAGTPRGYFQAEDEIFIPENNMSIVLEDQKIDLSIKKINEVGQPVKGADLRLFDAFGNQLAQWTSDGSLWQIGSFIEAGKTYKIYEMNADDSYYLKEMDIQVPNGRYSGPVVLEMVNEHISYIFEKVDPDGNAISGAELGLYDKTDDNREILTWHTSNEPLRINTLRRGHHYVLKELQAPPGYTKAADISFSVEERFPNNACITIRMQDEPIHLSILKIDAESGRPLAGAKLKLTSLDAKTIIDEWESTNQAHIVNHLYLEQGKSYLLEEIEAPEGWQKNKETVRIEIPAHGNDPIDFVFGNQPMHVNVLKTDENQAPIENAMLELKDVEGNVLFTWSTTQQPQDISSYLKQDDTYCIHEAETIQGKYLAEDVMFKAENREEPIIIQMIDESIEAEVLKLSEDGDWVQGAKMQLIDEESGEVIDTWKTVNQAHAIGHLLNHGKTYRIKETEWINGVHQAVEKVFQIPDTSINHVIQLIMVDTDVSLSFLKTDISGNPLAGAKLAIIEKNEDGSENVLAEFISDENQQGISQLRDHTSIADLLLGGHTYILREVETPFGYQTAEDISFCVNGTNKINQVVTLIDQPMKKKIRIHKVNGANHDISLAGAEFEIIRSRDQERYAQGITDQNGILEIELPYETFGYEIHEVKAPEGYQIAKEAIALPMDETIDFNDPKPIEIYIENIKEIPDTGDQNPLITFSIFLCALTAIGFLAIERIRLG